MLMTKLMICMSCLACAMDPPPAPMNAAAKLPMISEISHEQPIATTKKSSHALKYWNSVGSLVIVVSTSNENKISSAAEGKCGKHKRSLEPS